jgi:hypothetical protein
MTPPHSMIPYSHENDYYFIMVEIFEFKYKQIVSLFLYRALLNDSIIFILNVLTCLKNGVIIYLEIEIN